MAEERRKAWFTNKGQVVISITLLIQLLVLSFGAGKVVSAVEQLENQVFALTQRIARLEDRYFQRRQ